MKSISLSGCVIAFSLFCGCGQKNTEEMSRDIARRMVKYKAVYERDTALLSIFNKGNKVEGDLQFIYSNGINLKGSVKGEVKGDTLLADYHYKGRNGEWHRNPIALLKKDGRLLMGVGEREFAWGRTYFSRNVPIDYEKGRFVFYKLN